MIAALAARGFDLTAELATADYDRQAPPHLGLPSFGRARARAIVVGNTRAAWPRLRDAVRAAPRGAPDPLDAWVEAEVRAAAAEAARGARWEVRWAHAVPATVAIQRAAAVAGLAYLAPSHLCVHPVFGPWIALRAVIVLDEDGPPAAAPPVPPPCDCARGCAPALAEAIESGVPAGTTELRERWRAWLAVRDACPVGHAHRYDDDQILFHYAGVRPGSGRA